MRSAATLSASGPGPGTYRALGQAAPAAAGRAAPTCCSDLYGHRRERRRRSDARVGAIGAGRRRERALPNVATLDRRAQHVVQVVQLTVRISIESGEHLRSEQTKSRLVYANANKNANNLRI